MDRRTRILAGGFGLVVAYALFSNVVYPRFIEPLVTIDDRIEERLAELGKLEAIEKKVGDARYAYREWVRRIGSFDAGRVENDVRERINTLIEKHHLQESNISPGRSSKDSKTSVQTLVVTVQAVGSLESAIGFLRDVSELPHLARVGNAALYPASSSRKGRSLDNVNLRVPIELRVLPRQRIVGRIDLDGLEPADPRVRHLGRDYSFIWSGKPFREYVAPQPLHADAGRSQKVKLGRRLLLRGLATGGVGKHTYAWTPLDGLEHPDRSQTTVDTSELGERTYTLTVTDENGQSQTDTVTVTVEERVAVRPQRTPPKAKPTPDRRWKNRRYIQVVMALGQSYKGLHTDELMLYDRKERTSTYYTVGDKFDGGELVYVHQTGGLVRRSDEYFVYPIGAQLDQEVALTVADEFPELVEVAGRVQAAMQSVIDDSKDESDAGAGDREAPEKPSVLRGTNDAQKSIKSGRTSRPATARRRSTSGTRNPRRNRPGSQD